MCICNVLLGVLGKDVNSLYMLVLLCSSFTSKMLGFMLMAEGWLRNSGPINFFWDKIGPSILRSHVNERLYCECSTMTRLKRLRNKYRKLFRIL